MIALCQTDALLPRLAYYGYAQGWPKFGGYAYDRKEIVGMIPILGFVPEMVVNGKVRHTVGPDLIEAQSWLIAPETETWVVETDRRTYRLATGTESFVLDAIRRDKQKDKKETPRQLALLPAGV